VFVFANDSSISIPTLDHSVVEVIDVGEDVRGLSNSSGV